VGLDPTLTPRLENSGLQTHGNILSLSENIPTSGAGSRMAGMAAAIPIC